MICLGHVSMTGLDRLVMNVNEKNMAEACG